jgi:glycosyltransferase involved in cell wall biosynthesis
LAAQSHWRLVVSSSDHRTGSNAREKQNGKEPLVKLAIIGTRGLPARYSGFETFVMQVSPLIAKLGHEVLVIGSSVDRPAEDDDEPLPPGVTTRNLPLRANGIASIPYDVASFATVCRWADAVLLLGVSAGPFVPIMQRFTRRGRLVVNVDGLEYRRAKWSPTAKRYLAFAENLAIRGARHIVADNTGIANIIQQTYRRSSTIIAYGNDHVAPIGDDERRGILESKFGLQPGGYLLTIARIEPENNIDMMVEAAAAKSAIPYVVVGNFSASSYGQKLVERYKGSSTIRLIPANYDPMVLAALRSGCAAYLHGHSVGGTNPSLVEVLPYARPIIACDCSFNRYTLSDNGAYFGSTEELSDLLQAGDFERYTPPVSLQKDARYQWQGIAEQYAALAFGD